jgi:ribosome-associated translation inhibitor RaiA
MEQNSYYSAIDEAFAKLSEEIKKEKQKEEAQDE